MFNPQNYKKMKTEIAEKIKKWVKEDDIYPFEKFKVVYYNNNYTVLRNIENNLLTYILEGKVYKEEIPVYPIFSLEEIKISLIMFNRKEV